jgi:1-acyl-sn-glycerol-3-phosphate acyltransferase
LYSSTGLESLTSLMTYVRVEAVVGQRRWNEKRMIRAHAPAEAQLYSHARLERRRWLVHRLIEQIGFRILVKLERVEGLENLPRRGPAILMMNHIALLDPIVMIGCLPRNVVPLAKIEGFQNPFFAPLLRLWQVIPVHRGEVDRHALRMTLQVLEAGEIILLAPEGTRHASLQQGRVGVAYLGYKSGAPIIPVALEGTPDFPTINPARWHRAGVLVRLGRPFRFQPFSGRPRHEQLRRMTDEALYILAAMLPEARRGLYGDLSAATTETIEFL